MAVVLLRLKLAIQRRSRGRGSAAQQVWFVLAWLLAVVLGVGVGGIVGLADSSRSGGGDLAVLLIFTVVFLGWLLTPLLMPGLSDETVDPERLEQYPLTPAQQVAGLLLGALVAPTALFTFLVAAGGTVAAGEAWTARVAVLVAAALFTVLCVAASRAMQAALAGALRSRRGRDLVIAAGGVIAIALYLLSQRVHDLTDVFLGLENTGLEAVLGWLPPGSLGQSTLDARDGEWGSSAIHLVVGTVTIVLFVALWAWGIRRRVLGTSGGSSRTRRSRSTDQTRLTLLPPPISAMTPSAATAAAAQQLRYYARSPLAWQNLLIAVVIAAVGAHSMVGDDDLAIGVIFLTVIIGPMSAAVSNVFAFDDRGVRYLVLSGAPLDRTLLGKALVPLVVLVPLVAVFVVTEAVINDLWADAAAAFLLGLSILLVAIGVGAFLSVWAPQNRITRQFDRGRAIVATFGGLAAVAVVTIVLAGAWWLLSQSLDATLVGLPVLLVAGLFAWGLLRTASRRLMNDPDRLADQMTG